MPEAETKPEVKKEDTSEARFKALEAENKRLADELKVSNAKSDKASGLVTRMLTQLETMANARDNGQRGEATNGEDPKAKLKELFDEDPAAAVEQLFNSRVAPIFNEFAGNQAATNREAAKLRAKDAGLGKFDEEVDQFMNAMPADVKARPGAYDAAYRYIAANHIDDIVDERMKEKHERASRAEGATGAEATKGAKPTLDPMEKDMMKALGVSEEDWMKHRDTQEQPVADKPAAGAA